MFSDELVRKLVNSLEQYSSDAELSKLYAWPIDPALDKLHKLFPSCEWPENIKNSNDSRFKKTLALRGCMQAILTRNDLVDNDFKNYVKWIIKDWGGINLGNENKLFEMISESGKDNGNFGFERIASWSKFLAFKYPQERAIYDARVIFSLNWYLHMHGSQKYFPDPGGRNSLMTTLDYTLFILMKHIGNKGIQEEIIKDTQWREDNPGKDSKAISNLKKNLYIEKRNAYSLFCDLLKRIAQNLYADGDAHALTKVEMILFALADKAIILEVFESTFALMPQASVRYGP
jgi:hypothetical protein